MDLVEEISQILGFNYTIKLVEDGNYGSFNKETGKWNGMIGELQAQKADLVVADITITYEREQGVDFTMPFMNLGVTILYKKPTKKDPNLFSFLSPLSFDVWIYIITAYLAVSLLLFTISRFVFPLQTIIIISLWNDIIDNFLPPSPDSVLTRGASRKVTATIWLTTRDYDWRGPYPMNYFVMTLRSNGGPGESTD